MSKIVYKQKDTIYMILMTLKFIK